MPPQIPQCYICHQPGHVARNSRSRRTVQCYRCGQYRLVQRQCQGNAKGRLHQPLKRAPPRAKRNANPLVLVRFILVILLKCVSQLTGLICNIETSILLDTGSSLSLVSAKIAKGSKMPISHMKSVYVKTTGT